MVVSIIVPVYNVGIYLNRCVESVWALECEKELVLVDDGSTDESGELCDQWAEKADWIKVVHQQNGGLSAARNTGIKNATGEYIIFLDSDDFLDPKEAEGLISDLEKGYDVYWGFYRNYYSTEERYERENAAALDQLSGAVSMEEFLNTLPADGQSCYLIACRYALKRSFLLENQLFFMSGIYHEDEEWNMRLFCALEQIYISKYDFYQYRQAREGAITFTVRPKNIQDIFLIMEKAEALGNQKDLPTVKKEHLKNRIAQGFLNNLIHFYKLPKGDRPKALLQLKHFKPVFMSHGAGKIGKIVRFALGIFGIRLTAFLLHIADRLR